jgi:hypothetical protein
MVVLYHDWLQETILKKNIDPRGLARETGLPKHLIDSFRKGEILPNSFQMEKIRKALGISIGDMPDFSIKKSSKLVPVREHESGIKKETVKNNIKSNHKTPLQPIIDNTCVLTGAKNVERCHYDGPMQHLFGKGMSEKCDNLFVAEVSHEKHMEFHDPKTRKSIERSHEFLVAILLTIKRKVENGQIIFK